MAKPTQPHSDVVIIGAGLLGSSVAMALSKRGAKVRVIDLDLEGTLSSSELNAGAVRASLSQSINIEISKRSIEYFASHAEEVGYRACGYLWLQPAERVASADAARALQISHGWESDVWDVTELKRRVPFIDKTEGIAAAYFVPRDGLINPNLLKNHFRSEARAAGAQFLDRLLLSGAQFSDSGVELECQNFSGLLTEEEKFGALLHQASRAERVTLRADRVINCAGAWAPQVAKALGYGCPSFAVRRQVSIFDCRDVDLSPYGMIVDTSGVYFHPEATNGLAGFANHNEPPGFRFEYDGEAFFNEYIWPALYERSSHFERLRHLTGWAGLYEVSPDESGIIGQSVHSSGRVFEAHSFSGHGAMQSYSAGQALASLMSVGRYEDLDLSILDAKRFEKGRLLKETLVI